MTVSFGPAPWRPVVALSCVPVPCLSRSARAQDWPQFRGADGQGVARTAQLPVDFGPSSPDLQWKVEVKGDGISSPIVQGDRVLLTTAYPGTEGGRVAALQNWGLPLLAVLLLGLTLASLRRRTPEPAAQGTLFVIDGWVTRALTVAFVGTMLLAIFAPSTFPAWADGVFGWAWFYTGGITLVGLTAAIGWVRPRSIVRLLGVVALAATAVVLFRNIGLNSYGLAFKTQYRAVMVAPAVFGVLWHTALFPWARKRAADGRGPRSAPASALVVATAALLFFSIDIWAPRAGLMRAVLCYDLASGRELWHAPLFVAPQEQKYEINSFATPTPCTDGEYVFAYFGSGWACLDMDGKVLWQGRDDEYAPNSRYGCGASPVMFEDTFVVLQEREHGPLSHFVAFEKASGRERFRVHPRYASDSYCTPLVLSREGQSEIVAASGVRAVGHDPRTGELLWSVRLPIHQMVPSLCYTNGLLYVAGGTHTDTSTSAVRLSGTGKDTRAEVVWQTQKFSPQVSSPVVVDGHVFAVNDTGMMACLDATTGEILEKTRLQQGRYWSSLVAGGGKIYAISDEGVVTVLAATPALEELGKSALGEFCAATPAIAGNRMILRTADHLWCFASAQRAEKE
jgi:outer membrane protein assembly factor BamB